MPDQPTTPDQPATTDQGGHPEPRGRTKRRDGPDRADKESPAAPGAGTLDRRTLRTLLGHVRPHRGAILLGGALSLLGGAAGLVQPLAARSLVERLGEDGPIAQALIQLTALVLVGALIGALGNYVLERTAESVVLAARRQLVSRILRLRVAAVERTEPGDLMSRITSDTTLLRQVTTTSMVALVTQSLTLVGIVVMMAAMDPVLLGVTLAVVVLIGAAFGVVMPRIARATKRSQEAVGLMGAALERVLGAFRTVKAAGVERTEGERVHAAATEAWRQGVRVARWNSVAGTTAGLVIQISFLAVLGVGGARVASGATDVATLVAFLLYLFYLTGPISELVQAVSQLQVGAAAIARIEEVGALEVEPAGPEGPDAATVPAPRHSPTAGGREAGHPASGGPDAAGRPLSLRFEEVEFRYRPELPAVHHGVTFDVPAGGMTAFVGPSGAGKSTVFSLVERFYDPTGGRVLVGGREVRDWPLEELRAAIGYVEQDAPVLSGTLRENLLFGAPPTTDEEIREVLRRTRLDGLVDRLPDGLETVVGHRGSKLSGGERQRVAIARALLRRPRLLLLDEATSQLDAINELALRDAVAEAARTTTVLVVAHRLSTVTMADRIVVMEAGRVRAVGTHAELVRADPLYGELAATQFLASSAGETAPGADDAAPSADQAAPSTAEAATSADQAPLPTGG
ncbi:ABC transporter ATP-binding protein [Allostreptomyces psammosilenae]|uniref:ATP-binding cassette subfamily C protein n=1 Tax=Allostreptomyces psammosilenae TaxID=1892865 RepID=A0A852ZYI5_9ACTN|nr:ABC transporter ATP-binding protein [Allostreptomyces psammosilenae]NYI07443.1 ATP-binding cassette subfamily C protein [Allostreptomyces psammosilenae]